MAEPLVGPAVRVAAGHPQRARDVRAVATERAADVEHDRLARSDHPLRRVVMRRRGVGAGADDREVGRLVALGDEALADLARHVRLGPAHERAGRDLGHHAVGGLRGEPEEGDLVVVLDHAQLAQDRRGQRDADVWPERGLEAEHVHREHRVGYRDPPNRQPPDRQPVRVVGLVPGRDLDRRPDAGLGCTTLEAWHDEHRIAAGNEHEHREPLQGHRLVALSGNAGPTRRR